MKYVGIDIGDGESAVSVVSRDGALLPTVVPLGTPTASDPSWAGWERNP